MRFNFLGRQISVGWKVFFLLFLIGIANPGWAITMSKSQTPNTIGPGSVSTLTYTIDNTGSGTPAESLAFTHTLPANVTLASPANPISDCLNVSISAPDGGNTIALSDGQVPGSSTCTLSVEVTSSTPATHTHPAVNLTSSAGGASTAATVNLTVSSALPGFSKAFSPDSIPFGGRSTITYTIDNSASATNYANLTFTDNLPNGIQIASPANASQNCGEANTTPNITAAAGTDRVYLFVSGINFNGFRALPAGTTCTMTVDVVGNLVGTINSLSEELILDSISSAGKSTDALAITVNALSLVKSFTNDPVAAGGTVTLEYTITNLDRSNAATNIAFTDDLDGALSGLVADAGSFPSNPCGSGSSLSGTSTLSLSGGNLAAQGFCNFSVTLNVPAGAPTGNHTSTSGTVSGTVNSGGVVGNAASDELFVQPVPTLTMVFNPTSAAGGSTVNLDVTVTNSSATNAASNVAFTIPLINGLTSGTFPATPCGGSSSLSIGYESSGGPGPATPKEVNLTGGDLAASASCNFTIPYNIDAGTSPGTYDVSSTALSATISGSSFDGNAASASLDIVAAPRIVKSFTDDPAESGGTVSLQYTITHDDLAPGDATSIAFTDDYDGVITGLSVASISSNDCGSGASISGTSSLTFTGGTLSAGTNCTFTVTLNVPAGLDPGSHTSTTSNITATVSALSVTGNPASDDLKIGGINITKSFTDDPVIPGGTVTLQYTITNTSTVSATNISFTDNVNTVITGLASTSGTLNNQCGTGTISGTTFLIFAGGSLAAGDSCNISVTLLVPGGTATESYRSSTSNLSATMNSSGITVDPAIDFLSVSNELLQISKAFSSEFAAQGGTVDLEFTITNLDATRTASAITFTDDLDGLVTGLASTSGTVNDVCGSGSQISGTSTLTLTGGTIVGGGSCKFTVTLSVPSSVGSLNSITNTTSSLTGTIASLGVVGSAATADLKFSKVQLTKSFLSAVEQGKTVTLRYTITNLNTTDAITNLSFSDDLSAVATGLTAIGLPKSDVCGTGSSFSGTTFLGLTGATIPASSNCTFDIEIFASLTTPLGDFLSTSNTIFTNGIFIGQGSTAMITIVESSDVFAPTVTVSTIGGDSNIKATVTSIGSTISGTSLLTKSDDTVAGIKFPFGVLSYKVKSEVGGSETVQISFSEELPSDGFFVYKIDDQGNHTLIPDSLWELNGSSGIQLTLTDGGPFDLDGVANGEIIDPVSIGIPLQDSFQSFSLNPWESVAYRQWIASDPVNIMGISQALDVTIEGGLFSIDDGAFQSDKASIALGQTLKVIVQSSDTAFSTNTATVTVGTFATDFSVTTGSEQINQLLTHGNSCSEESVDWVQKFFIAYYGRPADTGGLNFWSCSLDDAGGSQVAILEVFGSSREFTSRYSGLSDEQLIDTLYQQLFNRSPEVEGKAYWVEKLNIGEATIMDIAIAILNGALGDDLETVNNKLEVAKEFTNRTGEAGVTTIDFYSILTNVTSDMETVTSAKDSIPSLVEQAAANEASF